MDTKQDQHREKAHGRKLGGNQAQTCKRWLPMESHRMLLIPPATSGVNTREMLSTGDSYPSLSAHSFYWGLVTQASSSYCAPRLHTSRGKALVQFRHMSHSDQAVWGLPWNPSFWHLRRPTLQAGPSKKYNPRPAVPTFSIWWSSNSNHPYVTQPLLGDD